MKRSACTKISTARLSSPVWRACKTTNPPTKVPLPSFLRKYKITSRLSIASILATPNAKGDAMNKCAEIADDYRRVTVAGAWYGPSLAELLARITPEHAVTKPEGGTHSIRELLQHLLLWNERIRKTNETCPMPKWEAEKEWGEAPIPWNELLERWNKS